MSNTGVVEVRSRTRPVTADDAIGTVIIAANYTNTAWESIASIP
jgi:hypothetical protein